MTRISGKPALQEGTFDYLGQDRRGNTFLITQEQMRETLLTSSVVSSDSLSVSVNSQKGKISFETVTIAPEDFVTFTVQNERVGSDSVILITEIYSNSDLLKFSVTPLTGEFEVRVYNLDASAPYQDDIQFFFAVL